MPAPQQYSTILKVRILQSTASPPCPVQAPCLRKFVDKGIILLAIKVFEYVLRLRHAVDAVVVADVTPDVLALYSMFV